MRGQLVVAALALMTQPSAAADCVAELAGVLAELSERHHDEEFRAAAVCEHAEGTPDAVEGILSALGDPAVRVVDAAHFERTLAEWTGSPVVGVGLIEVLSIDIDEQTGFLTVIAPVPGSPAAKAGLLAGDIVATIGGAATGPPGLTGSMRRLRVAAGEHVDLGILRDDRLSEVTLRAAELPPVEAIIVERLQLDEGNVLRVHLRQFVPGAGEKLRTAIERAGDVDAIVLDLRGNPGGLVDELQQAAGLFLAPGTGIARVAGPEPAVLAVAADAEPLDTPLYVIIGPGSASAAEALAGALQAHARARLYGGRTFGKGLVHQTLPLANDAVLMFPVGRLETPDGHPILGRGVDPDVRTPNPLTAIESDLRRYRRDIMTERSARE
jgi:carboxyl-terminal processing protease